jgi:hypothetical protein
MLSETMFSFPFYGDNQSTSGAGRCKQFYVEMQTCLQKLSEILLYINNYKYDGCAKFSGYI